MNEEIIKTKWVPKSFVRWIVRPTAYKRGNRYYNAIDKPKRSRDRQLTEEEILAEFQDE